MTLEKRLAAKEVATPETGYNLVSFDDYDEDSEPGTGLTVISHHDDEASVRAAFNARKSSNPEETLFIYPELGSR